MKLIVTIHVALFYFLLEQCLAQRPNVSKNVDITPIPMEQLNPRLTEFRRIDTNNDNSLTFTEFLLGDQPYIETQSRNFHNLDANADGHVSREEFETYYKQQDETHRRLRADGFFKQLNVKASQTGTGPIIVNLSITNDTILPKFLEGNIFDEPNRATPILFNFPPHFFGSSVNSPKNVSIVN